MKIHQPDEFYIDRSNTQTDLRQINLSSNTKNRIRRCATSPYQAKATHRLHSKKIYLNKNRILSGAEILLH